VYLDLGSWHGISPDSNDVKRPWDNNHRQPQLGDRATRRANSNEVVSVNCNDISATAAIRMRLAKVRAPNSGIDGYLVEFNGLSDGAHSRGEPPAG
jgi:hypothetical protein